VGNRPRDGPVDPIEEYGRDIRGEFEHNPHGSQEERNPHPPVSEDEIYSIRPGALVLRSGHGFLNDAVDPLIAVISDGDACGIAVDSFETIECRLRRLEHFVASFEIRHFGFEPISVSK
jgi:hypothetical protein